MKTLINKMLLLGAFATIFWSCKKDETQTVMQNGSPSQLSASKTDVILTKETSSDTIIVFSWTSADYGYPAAVKYTLQFDKKGNNFANPKEVDMGSSHEKKFSVIDFNSVLLSLGLTPNTASSVETRVKSQITSTIEPVYSNVTSLTATPYALTSFLFVPGDYQGWNPSTADSIVSAVSDGKYEGLINFPNKPSATFEFKLTTEHNWNVAYGDAGGGKISTTAGGNLKVPGAGTYLINANLNSNTWSATKTVWGIIGDATPGGWDTDTDMNYDQPKRTWTVTINLVAGKQYKFRLNHDWTVNLGSTLPGDGDQTALTGSLLQGGKNLGVAVGGNYTITLNVNTLTYTLVKN